MDQRPWLSRYDDGVPHSLKPYPDRTLLDYVSERAAERPDATALLFKGITLSYAELERLANAFAAALSAAGVGRGDRVALLLPNCPQFLIAELGAWKIGAIVVPLNPIYNEEELQGPLQLTEAKTIVVLTPFYERIKNIQSRTALERVIATNIKEYLPPVLRVLFTLLKEKKEGHRIRLREGDAWLGELLRRHSGAAAPGSPPGPGDPACILMSGGTTGTPKGVIGLHRNYVMAGTQLFAWLRSGLSSDDRLMLPLPLFHTYGSTGVQSLALLAGAPLSLIPNPRDIKDLLATIRKVRPAFFCGVPTLFNAIINHPSTRTGKVDFSSIKSCFSGAAPLMAETKKRFEDLTGGRIIEGYSLTEAQMAVVANPLKGKNKIGSVGLPLPDIDLRIVDPDTAEGPLAPEAVGEILMHAPQLMEGYWRNPEETELMLRPNGDDGRTWLYTGDLGYLDTDGYLFIVDRKKDLIKMSGYQVWPREVEEVISSHPAVAEVGVAGVLDAERGEAVKAWIVRRQGESLTAEEIRSYCKQKMAPYKVPTQIEFCGELPKTMVGKVLRRVLRERHEAKEALST